MSDKGGEEIQSKSKGEAGVEREGGKERGRKRWGGNGCRYRECIKEIK